MRVRHTLHSSLLVVAVALLASAFTPSRDVLFNESFAVRDGQTLALDVASAAVVVETTAGREATVRVEGRGRDARAEFERLRFTARTTGGRLVVRTDPRSRRPNRTDAQFTVTVNVPRRFDADIDTGSGSVRVGPLEGRLSVDTGSGSVRLGDVRGDVTVDTGSGSVQAGRVDGRLSVDTGSGSVSVAETSGQVSIDTGSGSVEVALSRITPLTVETGSGSVRISVPRGADADIEANGGQVRFADALGFEGRRERREATGRIGSGGPRLSVETGSGSITFSER